MKSLRAKVIGFVVLMVVLSIAVSGIVLTRDLRRETYQAQWNAAQIRSQTLEQALRSEGLSRFKEDLQAWRRALSARITLIAPDGTALMDSDVPAQQLPNHRNRPEVKKALQTGSGVDLRYSTSTGVREFCFARLVKIEGRDLVLRVCLPVKEDRSLLWTLYGHLLAALGLAGLLALLAGLLGANRILRSLSELEEAVGAAERGEDAFFPTSGSREIKRLSTAIRDMAQRLRSTLEDLEREGDFLKALLQSLPVGVLVVDPKGRVRYANTALTQVLRDLPAKLEGVPIQGALRSPELISIVESALKGKQSSTSFVLRGEERRFLEADALPTRHGALIVLNDRTEQFLLEESRRSFIADAGHELQTPLTAIRMAAELLRDRPQAPLKEREFLLNRIIEQQNRMTSLVDDLLLLSQLESGVPTEKEETIDLVEVLSVLVAEAKKHPLASHIEWRFSAPKSAPFWGRRRELERAFGNLLDNAIKFTHQRFGDEDGGRISVVLERQEKIYRLTVSDNGIGISMELRSRIFERFQRGTPSVPRGSGPGGYGLGLAIAQRVVSDHKGTISVQGDEGATFVVALPLPGGGESRS